MLTKMVHADIGGRGKRNLKGVCVWGLIIMRHEEAFSVCGSDGKQLFKSDSLNLWAWTGTKS